MTSEKLIEDLKKEDDNDYGIMCPPITAKKALHVLIEHFLGEDWYSMNPASSEQIYTEAICQILDKYPEKKSVLQFLLQ